MFIIIFIIIIIIKINSFVQNLFSISRLIYIEIKQFYNFFYVILIIHFNYV